MPKILETTTLGARITRHAERRWGERFPEESMGDLLRRFSRAKDPGTGQRRRIVAAWAATGARGRQFFRNGVFLRVHGDACFVVGPDDRLLSVYRF